MAQRVVDGLEVIKVAEEQRQPAAGPPSDRVFQPVAEQGTVRQPSQGIMERLVVQLAATLLNPVQELHVVRQGQQLTDQHDEREREEAV